MMFFPPYISSDEIVITNIIHVKTLNCGRDEILCGMEDEEFLGEINEDQILNMLGIIYYSGENNQMHGCIYLDDGIAEKQLENSKKSLLEKTRNVREGYYEKKRKRIVRFLSVIENPIFQKYKTLLSVVVSSVDSEYL